MTGGCSCGAVRYRLTNTPLIVHCCHCRNCQRQTGSAFVINAIIESSCVELSGVAPVVVAVPRDDGSVQRVYRCPHCQVALMSEYGRPHATFVRAGTLDDPSAVEPDVHIYVRSKLPWVQLPEGARAFDGIYDMQEVWPAASLERAAAARSDS